MHTRHKHIYGRVTQEAEVCMYVCMCVCYVYVYVYAYALHMHIYVYAYIRACDTGGGGMYVGTNE